MNFQYLSYALCVKRCGSFSQAAKVLYISQPALSKAVKGLEEELGFDLFYRKPKGISVTEEGKDFFDKIEPVLDQYSRIEDFYREKQSSSLKLNISSFDSNIFTAAFVELMKQDKLKNYQNLTFKEMNLEQLTHNVEYQISTIGLIYFPNLISDNINLFLQYLNLEYHKITEGQIYILTSKKNPYLLEIGRGNLSFLKNCIHIANYSHVYYQKFCEQIEKLDFFNSIHFKQYIQVQTCRSKYQILSAMPDAITIACHTINPIREAFQLEEFPIVELGKMEFGYLCPKEYSLSIQEQELVNIIKKIVI